MDGSTTPLTSKRSLFQNPKTNNGSLPMQSTSSSTSAGETTTVDNDNDKWAAKLLRDCAAAMSEKDSTKIHHLLWMLNELASPYGDSDQKLASYFLQALFCKATDSGRRCLKTLTAVAEKSHSFDSMRKLILKFQEVSPWTTFGHVASNGAMLEALEGETRIHLVDISNTLCTQWPTLLEALATRNDETPFLKLTVVTTTSIANSVMKEVAPRMEKFARLMGVPFEFAVQTSGLNCKLTKETLGVLEGEALAVNCVGAFRKVDVGERDDVIRLIRSLKPKIVTIVEEEADFTSSNNKDHFVACFEECLRFYTTYFDMLEESFVATSNEKLMLERECSRSIVRVLACDEDEDEDDDDGGDSERREKGIQWSERLQESGFSNVVYSDDVIDDVKALLKRYKGGWSLVVGGEEDCGIYLAWKDEPVVWASVWKP